MKIVSENWKHLIDSFPFIMMAGNKVIPDWPAITQGLIIAFITAGATGFITSYVTTIRLEEQSKELTKRFDKAEANSENRYHKLDNSLDAIRTEQVVMQGRIIRLEVETRVDANRPQPKGR